MSSGASEGVLRSVATGIVALGCSSTIAEASGSASTDASCSAGDNAKGGWVDTCASSMPTGASVTWAVSGDWLSTDDASDATG